MKNRRAWLMAAMGLSVLAAGCSGKAVPSSVSVSQEKLQEMLAKRFPKQYPVAGLLHLDLKLPQLHMRPERNMLNAVIPAELSGKVLKQRFSGLLDVDFALRYEPADRTLRAYQIKVNQLSMDGLSPALSDMLGTYVSTLAEQAMGQVELYQLQEQDLALVDALAIEPGAITVTEHGLTVALVPKVPTVQQGAKP